MTWGAALGDRRKEITLATKVSTRDGDEAMREIERCLKRRKTDHITSRTAPVTLKTAWL